MSPRISRRNFAAQAIAGSSLLLLPRDSSALDYTYTPSGFSNSDKAFLRKAMGKAMRLTRRDVIQNYVNLHRGGWNFGTSGAWNRSNNANNPRSAWRKKGNLLEYQVTHLAKVDDIPIKVRGVYAKNQNWWGRANLSTVAVISDGEGRFSVKGGFEFELNTWKFNAPKLRNGQNSTTWGAVIAHEMLHNLGHHHDKGKYGNDYPINLYENCVGYGGNYRRSYPRHFAMMCGGRIPS